MNAFAETSVRSVKRECLDHFIIVGEDHLRHVVDDRTHRAEPYACAPFFLATGFWVMQAIPWTRLYAVRSADD